MKLVSRYPQKKATNGSSIAPVILWCMLLAPFLRPNGLKTIWPPSLHIYDALTAFMISVLFLYTIIKQVKFTRLIIVVAVYFAEIAIVTINLNQDIISVVRTAASALGVMMIVQILSKRPRILISSAMLYHEILIYGNALSMLMHPSGMYLAYVTWGSSNNWIMGYDNHWFIFYYSAYCLAVLSMHYAKQHIRGMLMIIVLHLTTLYTMSGVLVFGLLLMDIVYLLRLNRLPWFNIKNLMILSITLTLVLVFALSNNVVQSLIYSIAKVNSFDARSRIWTIAVQTIQKHPITGVGRFYTTLASMHYGMLAGINAHNNWLEVLVQGGLIAFSLYVYSILLVYKKTKDLHNRFVPIALVAIFTMMMAMTVDSIMEYRGVMFYYFLTVLYYSGNYNDDAMDKEYNPEPKDSQLEINDNLASMYHRTYPYRRTPNDNRFKWRSY